MRSPDKAIASMREVAKVLNDDELSGQEKADKLLEMGYIKAKQVAEVAEKLSK